MEFYNEDFDPTFIEAITVPILEEAITTANSSKHLKSRKSFLDSGYDQSKDALFVRKKARDGPYIKLGLFDHERSLEELLFQLPSGPFYQVEDDLAKIYDDRFRKKQANTLFGGIISGSESTPLPKELDDDPLKLLIPELSKESSALFPIERLRLSRGLPLLEKPRANGVTGLGFSHMTGENEPSEPLPLSHYNPESPSNSNITLDSRVLLKSIMTLLFGFESGVFVFSTEANQFETKLNSAIIQKETQTDGGSGEFKRSSFLLLLKKFTMFGTIRKKVADLCALYLKSPQLVGIVGASFGTALESYLHVVDVVVLTTFSDIMPKLNLNSLMLVWNRLQSSHEVLRALDSFFQGCTTHSTYAIESCYQNLPKKEAVVDQLYHFIKRHMTYPLSLPLCILYNLFNQACVPYFSWISDLLCIPHVSRCSAFSSHVAPRDDPFQELSSANHDNYPGTLLDALLLKTIFESEISLKILKTHCPTHPLFLEKPPITPLLALHFTSAALASSTENWRVYYSKMVDRIKAFLKTSPIYKPLDSYIYAYQGCPMRLQVPDESSKDYPIDYEIFSKFPKPSLLGCVNATFGDIDQLINARDDFQTSECLLELNLIIAASFRQKVFDQCQLINRATHLYMIDYGKLELHLNLLNDFLLLSNGSFVLAIKSLLADALQVDAKQTFSYILDSLSQMLIQAVSEYSGCRNIPNRALFDLRLKESEGFHDFFESLVLQFYPVPPIDSAISQTMLQAYSEMFKLLLKLQGISTLLSRQRPPKQASRTVFLAYKTVSHFITSIQTYMYDRVIKIHHKSVHAAFIFDPFSNLLPGMDSCLSGIPLLLDSQNKIMKRMLLFSLRDSTFGTAEELLATCIRSALGIISLLLLVYNKELPQNLIQLEQILARFKSEKESLATELEHIVYNYAFSGSGLDGHDLATENPFLYLIHLIK